MRNILSDAISCLENGDRFVLATVIKTWGSAPRKAGSHMLITRDSMSGSVSGGCVENDVFRMANEIIDTDQNKLIQYDVSDETAWQVGLSCGGNIEILLETFSPEDIRYWHTIRTAIESNSGAVAIHALNEGKQQKHILLSERWSNDIFNLVAQQTFNQRANQISEIDGHAYFLEVIPPKHQLLIFGAAHLSAELVKLAKQFDFETIVIDPRGFFTEGTVFPEQPDTLHVAWPAEILPEIQLTPYTYAVTLSHDPKIDDQAFEILLRSEVAYIGALGSKKTHAKRIERLQAAGFTEEEIQRIHAPVGIDIRAQSAQEIALSILADLIKEKNKYLA
jgi:xanthine dehydrogenase accessory factor